MVSELSMSKILSNGMDGRITAVQIAGMRRYKERLAIWSVLPSSQGPRRRGLQHNIGRCIAVLLAKSTRCWVSEDFRFAWLDFHAQGALWISLKILCKSNVGLCLLRFQAAVRINRSLVPIVWNLASTGQVLQIVRFDCDCDL